MKTCELAGVTDPTGAAVNYGYDKTGRLSGVSGATFAGVSQYATGMQYRAFGGLESLTYGSNAVRTQTYNARQQLATLRVGTDLSADFQYHGDGQIRYAKDNTRPAGVFEGPADMAHVFMAACYRCLEYRL